MSAPRVVVVGAVNVDLVVRATRLPAPGETVIGPEATRVGGGEGANAAVAAAAAGARTRLIAAVGDDDAGLFALEDLTARGVDVSTVHVRDHQTTGMALIVVDPRGENQIAVGLGANAALDAPSVVADLSHVECDCVLISAELADETIVAAVDATVRAGRLCVLNPAPVGPGVVARCTSGVLLTPNAGEARALARELEIETDSIAEIADRLAARTNRAVVVTLGAEGSLIVEAAGAPPRRVAATAVGQVVDSTGAGDCFNGTLAASLARGMALPAAVEAATRAAAESVTWEGARRDTATVLRRRRPDSADA